MIIINKRKTNPFLTKFLPLVILCRNTHHIFIDYCYLKNVKITFFTLCYGKIQLFTMLTYLLDLIGIYMRENIHPSIIKGIPENKNISTIYLVGGAPGYEKLKESRYAIVDNIKLSSRIEISARNGFEKPVIQLFNFIKTLTLAN